MIQYMLLNATYKRSSRSAENPTAFGHQVVSLVVASQSPGKVGSDISRTYYMRATEQQGNPDKEENRNGCPIRSLRPISVSSDLFFCTFFEVHLRVPPCYPILGPWFSGSWLCKKRCALICMYAAKAPVNRCPESSLDGMRVDCPIKVRGKAVVVGIGGKLGLLSLFDDRC